MLTHHAREILSKLSILDINSTLHNLTNSVDVDSLNIRDFHNLSNLSAGNYTLWGQASDQSGGFSNEYQLTLTLLVCRQLSS